MGGMSGNFDRTPEGTKPKEEHSLEALEKAIKKLFEDDESLLESGVQERCIAARMASYTEQFLREDESFKDIHVDCEYNRRKNGDIKRRSGSERGWFAPDLIVHRREKSDENLLYVEMKWFGNKKIDRDIERVIENTQGCYDYKIGCIIILHESRFELRIYEKGRERETRVIPNKDGGIK